MKALPWIKKILFPFYNTEHQFLMEKWWFRLSIVVYVVVLLCLPFIFLQESYDSNIGWCYDRLSIYYDDGAQFNKELKYCSDLHSDPEIMAGIWGYGLLPPIVLHYLFQLIFFKIVINFIVLGNKKKEIS